MQDASTMEALCSPLPPQKDHQLIGFCQLLDHKISIGSLNHFGKVHVREIIHYKEMEKVRDAVFRDEMSVNG
jgi:hypothetical protein